MSGSSSVEGLSKLVAEKLVKYVQQEGLFIDAVLLISSVVWKTKL